MTNEQPPVNLHATMDAKVWADEFCRLNNASDVGMMLGWFANAIMVGYDHGKRESAAPLAAGEPESVHLTERSGEAAMGRADASGVQAAPASVTQDALRYRVKGAPDGKWHYVDHPELMRRVIATREEGEGGGYLYEAEPLAVIHSGVAAPPAPEPGPHIVPTVFPMFAVAVARRKWESLQQEGCRMQRIEFAMSKDGREKRGSIDPWGKVLWEPDSLNPSRGGEQQ